MNLHTWAELQKQALVRAGVNPVDADLAVNWVVENIPSGIDPETWIVAQTLFLALRQGDPGALQDVVAAWASNDAVETRHRRLLTATPATEAEAQESDDRSALGLLAAFWFLTDKGKYATRKPLRVVGDRRVRRQYEAYKAQAEEELIDLARLVSERQISPATWQAMMRQSLQRQHLTFRALGSGGMHNLSADDYRLINRVLAAEGPRITAMAEGILSGEISVLQAMNRAQWYVGTASEHFWQGLENTRVPAARSMPLERNILRPAEHCEDCLDFSAMGWQPPGVIPVPGVGRRCGRNCKCYKIYRDVFIDEAAEWIGTHRS